MVTINEFSAFDMRVGKILEVVDVEKSRKLYRLKVDLGEVGIRTIAAGIKNFYTVDKLIGKSIVVLANLEPKPIADFISEGMVLAAEGPDGKITLLRPDEELAPGSKVG